MKQSSQTSGLTILLDEPLLGLEVFLRDLGWNTAKVRQGMSDDEVLRMVEESGNILVTPDGILASRCRVKGVKVVELSSGEQARLVDQMLKREFGL